MDFSTALTAAKAGARIAREGWNGQNMFVFMVPGSTFKVNRPPLLGIFLEGAEIDYNPHLDMRHADGTIGTWTPAQKDLFSDDWYTLAEF